jgi:hypothetical protein
VSADLRQLSGDLFRREDEVDVAGLDRAFWHAGVTRGRRILRHREPTLELDGLDTAGPVRAGARQNDADRARPVNLGEGAEERVDRQVGGLALLPLHQPEMPVGDRHRHVRRDHIGVIRLDRHPLGCLDDGDGRRPAEQLGQHAVVSRVEMLDEHIGEPGIRWQFADQSREGLESAGRRADADDGRR